MIQTITSLKNDLVKRAASLKVKKYRQREGLFLLEGKRAVAEALASGWKLQCLFYTKLPEGWEEKAETSPLSWYEVTLPVLQKITATEDPQSVAALVELKHEELAAFAPEKGLVLVLDQIRDPGNLGTLIRTADALGAAAVVLLENTADLYNPKVVRSTMGSLFHLPIFTGVSVDALTDWCKKHRFALWVTALEGAEDVTKLQWPENVALVLGSEAEGVSPELLSKADQKVKIPMAGHAESLNVAIAGGILLFEASRNGK